MYNTYHVINFRSWHLCEFYSELHHFHKHQCSPSASLHSNPMLEEWNQHSSRITYPRQTSSTIHECFQKHDKVIKAAIWSRPPYFPDPKTNRVFRGWDGAGEPIPTPGNWTPTSEMLNICCQHPICLRTCSRVPWRRADRSEQFLAARQRHHSHRCVCDLWTFDTTLGEMANSDPCKIL